MTDRQSEGLAPPMWARAMSSEDAYWEEQGRLGSLWTFLGFEQDCLHVNDWFRTTLGGRSIFVQRFEKGLRGFENLCVHRFHPIRTADRGNGPMVCGFHQWRYNQEGLALGVPKCEQMYGKTPRELDARLRLVEVEVCGGLIFGRFGGGPSLEEWLGPGFAILANLTQGLGQGGEIDFRVRAHWKLMLEVSLEEYHLVAVHPTTFGKRGHHAEDRIGYFRFGAHSTFFFKGEPGDLEAMAEECREQRFVPRRYRIFQFFPTLIVATLRATRLWGDEYWYLLIQHVRPEAHDRTRSVTHFFPLPFARPAGPLRRLVRRLTRPWIWLGFQYYARKIHQEDNGVCERVQQVAHQIEGHPILASQERRVGWFEEEYARFVTPPGPSAGPSRSEG